MKPHRLIARQMYIAWIVMILTAGNIAASAAESVTVTTKSGRTFRGVVDARTDDAKLWLRFGTAQAQIMRPLAWTGIDRINYEGRELSASAFQKVANDVMTAAPKMPPFSAASEETDAERTHTDAELAQQALAASPAVARSLYITAAPANWDSDVEVDGLIVTIYPRDEYGELVHVSGSLEVELVTEMSRMRETITAGESRIRNQRIGRWVRAVAVEDFGPLGASFKLPFEAVHPEFSQRVIDFSLVNARLSVPGEGMLWASTTAVRIQPLSPTRDRLENRTGSRFFPIERTGRGKQQN